MTRPSSPIHSVQVLRALAALCVLLGHLQQHVLGLSRSVGESRSAWIAWAGGFGVDLFFCISGFIIALSARKLMGLRGAGWDFMARRLIRVVPLYWLATFAYLPIYLLSSSTMGKDWLWPLLTSLAFVPYPVFGEWAAPYPILTLGWTLNYEMWFYVSLAAVLSVARSRVVTWTAVWMAGLVLLGVALGPDARQLYFWSRPIVLEFVLGAVLGLAHARDAIRLSGASAWMLIGASVTWVILDPFGLTTVEGPTPNDLIRLLAWGAPAALILFCAVASRPIGALARRPALAPLVHLGDASYSLYLLHPFVLIVLGKAWMAASLHRVLPWWSLMALAVTLAWCIAKISHRWIELNLSQQLTRRWMEAPRQGAIKT